MSTPLTPHYADVKGRIILDFAGNICFGIKAGAPTASLAGYSKGCLFVDYTNGIVYQNTGTTASSTWSAIGAASSLGVQGVAAGYKVARSAEPVALDGSNPTTVATGLTTVVSGGACLSGTAAPGLSTSTLSVAISTTNLDIYAWKPTGAGDTTLIASTGTESFHWWAIGT